MDHKIDNLVIVVNQMMQRVNINDQIQERENQNVPQTRNQNFIRNVPQIKQRKQKGSDQQVWPPFQKITQMMRGILWKLWMIMK